MTSKIVHATKSRMAYLSTLELNKHDLNGLGLQGDKILMLFHSDNKIIRAFDVESDFVYKVIIIIQKVLPDFIGQLGSIFIELNVQTIFTSALCFHDQLCTYEAYFEANGLSRRLDSLIKRIKKINGVKDLVIKTISIEK